MAQPAEPAEQTEQQLHEVVDEDEDNPNYKVPEKKALDEMLQQDKDDESLEKYKKELLQGGEPGLELCKFVGFLLLIKIFEFTCLNW